MSLPLASAFEREIYHDYDKERRLRLTRNFAATFFILLVIALISTPFTLGIRPSLSAIAGALWPPSLAVVMYALSWWLTRHQQDIWAASLFLGATMFVVVEFQVQYALRDGVGPLTLAIMAAYGNTIANGGMIGNTWILGIITGIENLLTVLLLVGLPLLLGQAVIAQLPIVLATLLMVQWGMALSYYFGSQQHLRTLRELGDIRVAYARAQQVEAIKNQFITSVNHELRTPIMTMIGWIENLQANAAKIAATSDAEATQQAARTMQANLARAEAAGHALTTLINSILDAERLDQDVTHWTPCVVTVAEAMQAARTLMAPLAADERAIQVSIPPQLQIWGNAVWLQQILGNLIANASKYSAPDTPIEVTATLVEEGRGRANSVPMVDITVRDYGLGIPPAQMSVLFQKFVRLPRDLASTTVGNGLGLWLCHQLTQAMGGRIWVTSTGVETEGSTFHVRLPRPDPARSEAAIS